MNERLKIFIDYVTQGRLSQFGRLLGWSPQYLAKILSGRAFGLQPVLALLETFPELNARWLLLGEGQMLMPDGALLAVRSRLADLLELERFVPFMAPAELELFAAAVRGGAMPSFAPEVVASWQAAADARENAINARVAQAAAQSDELCKQMKGSK